MNEQLDITAAWRIPGGEATKFIMGRLTFDANEGGMLELWGYLAPEEYFGNSFEQGLLVGASTDGKLITLEKCSEAGLSFASSGVPKRWFRVEVIYIGVQFSKPVDIALKDLFVEYSNLQTWVQRSAFEFTLKQRNYRIQGSDIRARILEPISLCKTADYTVRVFFGLSGIPIQSHTGASEFTAKQSTSIHIRFAQKARFDPRLPVLYYLHGFLSLCMGGRVGIKALTAGRTIRGGPEVKIYYRPGRGLDMIESIKPEDMILTLPAAGKNIGTYFSEWSRLGEDVHPIYDMYLATVDAPSMYIEHKFLSMVQACESLMRYREGNSKKDFDLNKKLPPLLEKHRAVMDSLIPDQRKFVKEVTLSRHYYTHRNLSQRRLALMGAELITATRILKILLEMEFLDLMSVESTVIESAIRGRYRVRL